MKIKVKFEYTVNVTPPRCRKPRPMIKEYEEEVEITEVTGSMEELDEKFPRAFTSYTSPYSEDMEATEYRAFKDKIYEIEKECPQGKVDEFLINTITRRTNSYSSLRENLADVRESASIYLLVNKLSVYCEAFEPGYRISTFGLGHNHGGTALFVTPMSPDKKGNYQGFRADERDEAVKAAVAVALDRGDTESIKSIQAPTTESHGWIVVHDKTKSRIPPLEERNSRNLMSDIEDLLGKKDFDHSHPGFEKLRNEIAQKAKESETYKKLGYSYQYELEKITYDVILDKFSV